MCAPSPAKVKFCHKSKSCEERGAVPAAVYREFGAAPMGVCVCEYVHASVCMCHVQMKYTIPKSIFDRRVAFSDSDSYVCMCMYMCVCVCIYMHTYSYIYIHTHTHTHMICIYIHI